MSGTSDDSRPVPGRGASFAGFVSWAAVLVVATLAWDTVWGEPAVPATAPSVRPDTLTVTIGDVTIAVDGGKMWTLGGIEFRGTVMATPDSAYGTVLTFPESRHLGSAHVLDVPGSPGAVETEHVVDLRFFLDDEPVIDISPQMHLRGGSFRMERSSRIRALHLDASVELRAGVLVETVRFRTAEPIALQSAYPLMYAWTPAATTYLFGNDAGIGNRGTFRPDGERPQEGVEKTASWMAVYEPVSGCGGVCAVIRRPEAVDAWMQYTDGPGIYRKLRLMSFISTGMPAGFDGTFACAVGFFAAAPGEWERAALRRIDDLRDAVAARTSIAE